MQNLQKRLTQLYDQQAIEEKKVLESIQHSLTNLSPLTGIKNTVNEILSNDEIEPYYSKRTFTLLLNKTIDSLVPKPDLINQTIKVLVQKRFVDVMFNESSETSKETKSEVNCVPSEI
jgi:F0F1-type ATP synthase delta subunit